MADWIDGPKLVKWLGQRVEVFDSLGPAKARAVQRWRSGSIASVYAVDELLTSIGIHISEVPEEFWVQRKLKLKKYPPEFKAQVCAEVRDGSTQVVVARRHGVSRSAVGKWLREGL